jgi:hypothetical protein
MRAFLHFARRWPDNSPFTGRGPQFTEKPFEGARPRCIVKLFLQQEAM